MVADCSISEPFIKGQSPGANKRYPRRAGLLAGQRATAHTGVGGKRQGALSRGARDQKPNGCADHGKDALRPDISRRSDKWPLILTFRHVHITNDAELKGHAGRLSMVNLS